MRSFAENFDVPYEQFGFQVGRVIDSKNSEYGTDTYVVSHSGWKDFVILDGKSDNIFAIKPEPTIDRFPLSYALGVLGMPGLTAFLVLLNIILCQPKHGDIVCGSLVGQIAKIKGCTVIGFAGTDEKVNIVTNDLGFHHAFNYKTANINESLKTVAPNGVDCYFDNVGGNLSENIYQ